MRVKIILSIILLIGMHCTFFGQGVDTDQWILHKSDKGHFTILMPEEPEYLQKKIATSVGEMNLHSYMCAPEYTQDNPNLMYLIEYYDYPEGTFPVDSVDLKQFFYDHTASANSAEIGGKLVYQSASTVDGIPGVIYRCQYKNDEYVMKARMFFVGDRFYHLKVYSEKARSLNDEMDYFLGSFRIIRN